MPPIATPLEAPEHLGEIDGALAGLQVLLVVAAVVGQPHLAAAREADGIEEAPDALRDQVRMVDGEGPPERGRGDAAEVLAALLDAEREVAHLGMLRLAVQVFEEEAHAGPLGPLRRAREPRNARFPAGRVVRREVKPAVHDDPFGVDLRSERDIGLEIAVDRLRDEGRRLRDIDPRQRVQAEMNAAALGRVAHGGHALVAPEMRSIGRGPRGLQAKVQVADAVGGRPGESLLDRPASAEVDPDALAKRHARTLHLIAMRQSCTIPRRRRPPRPRAGCYAVRHDRSLTRLRGSLQEETTPCFATAPTAAIASCPASARSRPAPSPCPATRSSTSRSPRRVPWRDGFARIDRHLRG